MSVKKNISSHSKVFMYPSSHSLIPQKKKFFFCVFTVKYPNCYSERLYFTTNTKTKVGSSISVNITTL